MHIYPASLESFPVKGFKHCSNTARAHKGDLSVGRRLKILRNVRRQLTDETVSVGLKWSVKCQAKKSECRCRATLILG